MYSVTGTSLLKPNDLALNFKFKIDFVNVMKICYENLITAGTFPELSYE